MQRKLWSAQIINLNLDSSQHVKLVFDSSRRAISKVLRRNVTIHCPFIINFKLDNFFIKKDLSLFFNIFLLSICKKKLKRFVAT